MGNIDIYKCHTSDSIVEAMRIIDMNSYGLVYVVDDSDKLVGCTTDGDIRRWLLKGGKIKSAVSRAMNPNPIYVTYERRNEASRCMAERMIPSIAVVDDNNHLIDVIFTNNKKKDSRQSDSLSDTPVIVMAGGKGTRLYPYTKILPKPLIPVGGVPIIERILDRFACCGVNEFYLTLNYRREMIKSYFAESEHPYSIHFIEEDKPLGTAGSIRLINKRFDQPLIITNCDVLIETDYGELLKHHVDSGNDLTIVSSLRNTIIPYGVLHAKENGIITDMEEKPEISSFINTGMYVLDPQYISFIPMGEVYHMTQLANEMIMQNKQVGMYPISENSFLDMGEFAEMKRMEEKFNNDIV